MRLPLVTEIDSRNGTSDKDARLTNALLETDEGASLACVRPGLALNAEASGVGQGLVVFNDELISVFGTTLGTQPIPDSFSAVIIGALGTGNLASSGASSSDGSVVVGGSRTTSGGSPYHAFRYASATMTDLGVLGADTLSSSTDVSDDGTVVVGYSGTATFQGFRWTSGGGMVSIGAISTTLKSNVFTSSDGSVIAGNKSNQNPFRWTSGGGMVDLGLGSGFTSNNVQAISKDGSTIVGYGVVGGNEVPWVWTSATGIVQLESGYGYAYGVSSDGSVIVGISDGVACVWSVSGVKTSIDLLPGATSSIALNISNDGLIVAGTCDYDGGSAKGFYWSASNGATSIGLPNERVTVVNARYISSDGLVVGGYYIDDFGNQALFTWTNDGKFRVLENDSTYTFSYVSGMSGDGTLLFGNAYDEIANEIAALSTTPIAAVIPSLATVSGDHFDFAQSPL